MIPPSVLVDIKRPDFNYDHLTAFSTIDLRDEFTIQHDSKEKPFSFLRVIFGFLMFCSAFLLIFSFFQLKSNQIFFTERKDILNSTLTSIVTSFRTLTSSSNTSLFSKDAQELKKLKQEYERSFNLPFSEFVGNVIPSFKEAGNVVSELLELSGESVRLSELLNDLSKKGFYYVVHDGETLIRTFSEFENMTNDVLSKTENLRNSISRLKERSLFFSELDALMARQYVNYNADFQRSRDFLKTFKGILTSNEGTRASIVFLDSDEIRAGGGIALGISEIALFNGQLTHINGLSSLKIEKEFPNTLIPPHEIQILDSKWRFRDAFWFPNSPSNAETAIRMLAAVPQELLGRSSTSTPDVYIVINKKAIQSLLEMTGSLNGEGIVYHRNSIFDVMKEANTAPPITKTGKPITSSSSLVFSEFPKLLLESIASLPEEKHEQLVSLLRDLIREGDIILSSPHKDISRFLNSLNADGSIISLPNNFFGGYFSLYDANMSGSPDRNKQTYAINIRAALDSDGGFLGDVGVERSYPASSSRTASISRALLPHYLHVLVTPGSRLVSLKGNTIRPSLKSIDYEKLGYTPHDLVVAEESESAYLPTLNAWITELFQKTKFGLWFQAQPEKMNSIEFRYHTPGIDPLVVYPGHVFRFIFQKQPGMDVIFSFRITAPIGYVWKESGSPVFSYEHATPNLTESIDITLQK